MPPAADRHGGGHHAAHAPASERQLLLLCPRSPVRHQVQAGVRERARAKHVRLPAVVARATNEREPGVRCAANGSVRVHAVLSNDTSLLAPRDRFSVEELAVVADRFWDAATSQLCLSACRVVRSAAPGHPPRRIWRCASACSARDREPAGRESKAAATERSALQVCLPLAGGATAATAHLRSSRTARGEPGRSPRPGAGHAVGVAEPRVLRGAGAGRVPAAPGRDERLLRVRGLVLRRGHRDPGGASPVRCGQGAELGAQREAGLHVHRSGRRPLRRHVGHRRAVRGGVAGSAAVLTAAARC